MASDPAAVLGAADLVLKVNPPVKREPDRTRPNGWAGNDLISAHSIPLQPSGGPAARVPENHRVFDYAIPRTTRAQSMDTLSSMANLRVQRCTPGAGELNKYFPMLMTAAGMVGLMGVFEHLAAVAGLQAIATARRLGANVFATDAPTEVKEQIESVGGKYVGIGGSGCLCRGGYAKG